MLLEEVLLEKVLTEIYNPTHPSIHLGAVHNYAIADRGAGVSPKDYNITYIGMGGVMADLGTAGYSQV